MARSEDIKTPLARLAFENLIVPGKRLNQKTGKEVDNWNCNLLWPKDVDLSAMKNAAVACAVQEWGDKAKQMIADGVIKSPFLDGDGKEGLSKKTGERWSGYEGSTFIRVGSTQKPKLVNKRVEPITERDELYAGCYVYAVINAFTWTHPTNGRGVSFGLSMIQVAKDGERLGGGGGDPSQHFEKIDDEGPAPKSSDGAAGLFG
jgi:hypothetical protein